MLDRLPPELLAHVLRCAAPLDARRDKVKERRDNLRSFSLVCRAWCDLAQPMLPEVWSVFFALQPAEELLEVDKEGRTRGSRVKVLVLEKCMSTQIEQWEPLLRVCSELEELHLWECMCFDLKALREIRNIRRLVLRTTILSQTAPPPPLPHLSELSLDACTFFSGPPSSPFFTRSWLPSLRAVAWHDPRLNNTANPLLDPALSAQLDVFFTDFTSVNLASPNTYEPDYTRLALPPASRIQVRHMLANISQLISPTSTFTPLHLSFDASKLTTDSPFGPAPGGIRGQLEEFHELLQSLPVVHSVELPDFLHPSRPMEEAALEPLRAQILERCAALGVEVDWAPSPSMEESRVSQAFWRKIRAEQARGGARV